MNTLAFILALISVVGAEPTAQPEPQEILTKSITQAKSIHIAPYLRYKYKITMTHKESAKSYSYSVLERLSDHYGRFTGLEKDGSDSQDIHLHAALVSPGLFLNALVEDSSDAAVTSTAVIGRVVAVPYTATLIGIESVDGCNDAYHLMLQPKGDPERLRLREIWVDENGYRICHAKIHQYVNIMSREAVTIDMALDTSQFVQRWSFSGTGHTPLGTYSLRAVGQFADVVSVPTAEDGLFR